MSLKKFTTLDAASRLMSAIKQTATDCKELLVERQRLEQMMKDLTLGGTVSIDKDYTGGFAEKFSK